MDEISEPEVVELPASIPFPAMSPLIASTSHFLFIIVICQIMRFLCNILIRNQLVRAAMEEFICTIQLCASNFELGIVTEVYGFSGYAIGLFLTSLTYSLTFDNGTADPSECLYNLCKRQISLSDFLFRSVFSVAGAAVSYRAARVFWSFQLIPEHVVAYEGAQLCTASLQVTILMGFMFEFGETFVNRLMQNTNGFNMLGGALADVSITFFGLFVTGGYFNPSLALAMELGCSGLEYQDFFIIYFGGPALATLIATQAVKVILPLIQQEPSERETVVRPVTSRDKSHRD